jgi:hypothetical protein
MPSGSEASGVVGVEQGFYPGKLQILPLAEGVWKDQP